jgi:hypothetical protein
MRRWIVAVLGSIVLAGLTLLACYLDGPQEERVAVRCQREGPANFEEVIRVAEALHLHWTGDPPGSSVTHAVIVSDQPVTLERHERLYVGHPDLERWRGVVKIYRGGQAFLSANVKAAYPERYAVWGELSVYGDPELIAKLLASSR